MQRCIVVTASAAAAIVVGRLALRWLRRPKKTGTLWASPISTCSRRVILALKEAGVTGYTFHPIDLFKKEQKTELYLAMQPYGKVPVWQEEDRGLTLFESRAIMRHVAAGSPLIPSDPALEALMDQWISVEYSYFYPDFVPLYRRARTPPPSLAPSTTTLPQRAFNFEPVLRERVLNMRYIGVDYVPDASICAARTEALRLTLNMLDQHLRTSGGDYLVGRYSLADVTFTPYLEVLAACGLSRELESRPALAAWVKRCLARPAWRYCLDGGVMEHVAAEPAGTLV